MTRGNRVVVVSMGIESSIGHNVHQFWTNLLNQQCGIRRIQSVDPTDLECQIGAEVWDFEPTDKMQEKWHKFYPNRSDKATWFAESALNQALLQSPIPEELLEEAGILIGSNMVGAEIIGKSFITEKERGAKRVDPQVAQRAMPNAVCGALSIIHHMEGGGFAPASACATGAHAIGEAFLWVQQGFKPFVFAGGTEWATIKPLIASFGNLGALTTTHNDCPGEGSRPFDEKRDGFVPGEGSAIFGITTPELAQKYNWEPLVEIIGYGTSFDAKDMIHPTGKGATLAMKRALSWAEINAEDVDGVGAHATSTWEGDEAETKGIKDALGKRAYEIPVVSIKGQVGHGLGAAAAIESVSVVQGLRDGIFPSTFNLVKPSEECDLDYVPGSPREYKHKVVVKNSFGFGGNNASLVFKKWDA